jgi:hypothetical protein
MTVTAVGGAPATDVYALAASLGALDVTTSDPVGTSHVTGSFRFSRNAGVGEVTERAEAEPGAALTLAETGGGVTTERRATAFSVISTEAASGASTFASAGDVTTVATAGVAGDLAVRVTSAVRGAVPNAPEAGAMTITAADGTSLTLEVGTGGAVALGLDGDGDGAVDATISTAWAELR